MPTDKESGKDTKANPPGLSPAGSDPRQGRRFPRKTAVAVVLVAAGLYQLSPLKRACLRACRGPLGFLMSHWRPGYRGALERERCLRCRREGGAAEPAGSLAEGFASGTAAAITTKSIGEWPANC